MDEPEDEPNDIGCLADAATFLRKTGGGPFNALVGAIGAAGLSTYLYVDGKSAAATAGGLLSFWCLFNAWLIGRHPTER